MNESMNETPSVFMLLIERDLKLCTLNTHTLSNVNVRLIDAVCIVCSPHPRQGAGPLCNGAESLSIVGPGLPDDGARPECGHCYRACAAAALHSAQSRLPEAAESAGHCLAGGEAQ